MQGTAVDCLRVHGCFMSIETERTIRDGVPRMSTSTTFTQLLSSETRTRSLRDRTNLRDGEPRMATSTFTQLLNSVYTFSVALRPQRPYGL